MPRLTVDVALPRIPTSDEVLAHVVLVTDEDGKGVAKLLPASFTIRAFRGVSQVRMEVERLSPWHTTFGTSPAVTTRSF
jgi:hypothetical protein